MVLTILKNTSQCEGLAHILWKENMFETTNQYHILSSFINLTMAKTRVVHGYPPFPDSQKYKYPAVHSYEPLPMYKCDLPIQNGGFPYRYNIYIYTVLYYIYIYIIYSHITHKPRGLPGLQHWGFSVVEHEKRNCRKYCVYAVFPAFGFRVFRVLDGFRV